MNDVNLVEVVAVVNHLGERLLINRDQYRSGQWQLWEEPPSTPTDRTDESSSDSTGSRRKRRRDSGGVDHYIAAL